MSVRPIFLLSLPRAGSTLVQRVIGAHEQVATVSEPWVLLPLLYSLRENGVRAEYWHEAAAQAIGDFSDALPGGQADYRAAIREAALRLYEGAAGPDATHFLDKTPHYHLIAAELLELFDEARFVFLWRNPLAIVSSLLETFRSGHWEPHLFRTDLFQGVVNLTDAWEGASDRACAVRYEDLVRDAGEWRRMFDYLELDFDASLLEDLTNVRLEGRYGDRTGAKRYAGVSEEPAERWRGSVAGPVRKAWCRRYLRHLGERRLALMRYDIDALLTDLDSLPSSPWRAPLDLTHLASSRLWAARRDRRLRLPDSPRPTRAGGARRMRRGVRRLLGD